MYTSHLETVCASIATTKFEQVSVITTRCHYQVVRSPGPMFARGGGGGVGPRSDVQGGIPPCDLSLDAFDVTYPTYFDVSVLLIHNN